MRGSIKIFYRNFFVSRCRKISKVNPSVLCFRKLPVAKKFMDKRGGGGVSRFSVENFFSHSAENFRMGESFSVSLISGIEKVWMRGGRGIKIFHRKCLVSQCRKMS